MCSYGYCALSADSFVAKAIEMIQSVCACAQEILDAVEGVNVLNEGDTISTTVGAAAATIATLLVVIEMCSQAMGFHFEDINDAVRFVFKVVVYKIVLENSSRIVGLVYGLFMNTSAWDGVSGGFDTINERFTNIGDGIIRNYNTFADADDSLLSLNTYLMGFFVFVAGIIVVIICVNIIASIAGLMFELCINVAIAPVPISTLVNSQTRQIGINFIKAFSGNCLTLTMYTICFNVYGGIADQIGSSFGAMFSDGDGFNAVGLIVPEIVGLVLLTIAVKNVSTMISKVLS